MHVSVVLFLGGIIFAMAFQKFQSTHQNLTRILLTIGAVCTEAIQRQIFPAALCAAIWYGIRCLILKLFCVKSNVFRGEKLCNAPSNGPCHDCCFCFVLF